MTTTEQLKYKKIAAITATVMLLLAIPPMWPYAYYQILRWVVAGAAVFIGYLSYQGGKKEWVGVMAAIAVLFNPIAPIHLSKETWVIFDFAAAAIFVAALRFIKPKTHQPKVH